MENFINALTSFNASEITSELDNINQHISKGYLTYYDKFFLDYIFPSFRIGNSLIKKIRGDKNVK